MLVAAEAWSGDEDCMVVLILETMIQLNQSAFEEEGNQLFQDDFVDECKGRINKIQRELAMRCLSLTK